MDNFFWLVGRLRWRHTALAKSCFCLFAIQSLCSSANEGAEPAGLSTADRLVNLALRAETTGDSAARSTALNGAVRISPELKAARWQTGHIEVDGKWLPAEQAQRAAASDSRLRQYGQLRIAYGSTPAGVRALARWCSKNGLTDEARFNWALLLTLEPNSDEALRALDVSWLNGRLLTRDQLSEAKEQERQTQKATHTWKKRLDEWVRQLDGDVEARTVALREIRAVEDPEVIPYLQSIALGNGSMTDEQLARRRQLSLAFLDALEAMQGAASIESQVQLAVRSPIASVQRSAIARLKKRPMQDYVPLLLAELQPPIESKFAMNRLPGNNVEYAHQLYRRGADADTSMSLSRSFVQVDSNGRTAGVRPVGIPSIGRSISDQLFATVTDVNAQQFEQQSAAQALSTEQRVAAFNRLIAEKNARILPILAATTDKEFGSDPNAWWDWWEGFNEYDSTSAKPVYAQNYSDSVYCYVGQYDDSEPGPDPPTRPWVWPRRKGSCFPRGTPVWTKTGLRPIETLHLGDFVLAQNVDTGEVGYKPVVGNTVRPPGPIVQISAGTEQVRSTLGHPFWVSGVGWRMAKELEVGNVIHGVKSAPRIDALQPVEQEEAYNLIVAEFSTYFVGQQGILVHDNTPRRPTQAVIPGFTAAQISE